MTVVVTAASGQLGHLVVEDLLSRGVPADQIVAGSRDPQRLADLAAKGVRTARIDYDDPASLDAAFAGAEKVLLVSGTDFGKRVAQHSAAAKAAAAAGVGLLVYTSAPYASTTKMKLADEHRETEAAIREVGIPFAFLRNGWYFENYLASAPAAIANGAVIGSAGDGRVSGAARADYAAAAAAVLATDGHENKVYELGGDAPFTLTDLAAELSARSGTEVVYRDLPAEELAAILESAGVPAPVAPILADVDVNIRAGALFIDSGDLARLIGRPAQTLPEAVAAADL